MKNSMTEQLAIVDHYAKGGKVTYRFLSQGEDAPWMRPGSLKEAPLVCFNFYDCQYKIVVEPRTFYMLENKVTKNVYAYPTETSRDNTLGPADMDRFNKFEVVEKL